MESAIADNNHHPVLHTERLGLRLPAPGEAVYVARFFARNIEHLRPFQPALPEDFATTEFWARELAGAHAAHARGEVLRWFLFDTEGDANVPVGYVSLTSIKRANHHSAELSYAIDHDRCGEGLMREAVSAVLAFAWSEMMLHRIDAKYRHDNARSGRLLDALGFITIGVAPGYAQLDGDWRDHVLCTLIRSTSRDDVQAA